MEGYLRCS